MQWTTSFVQHIRVRTQKGMQKCAQGGKKERETEKKINVSSEVKETF